MKKAIVIAASAAVFSLGIGTADVSASQLQLPGALGVTIAPARVGMVDQQATPLIGTQLAEIEGSDTVSGAWFGDSVAVSGSTIVVGAFAPLQTSLAGRAYVFTKTAAGWHQTAELEGPDTVAGDSFGGSVAVSGSTVVVGASGHALGAGAAYVFTNSGMGWQETELNGSDTVAGDHFGHSVAVSGSTVVVGAIAHASGAGRAYVFTKTATGWHQTAELKGSDTVGGKGGLGDGFGESVALVGGTMVVGSGFAGAGGRAYVFTKTAAGWHQTAELEGSDTSFDDEFGESVGLSGSTIVVGAEYHALGAGAAYVFTNSGTGWHQTAELKGSDTVANDGFGDSVALSGSTMVVGAFAHDSSAGSVYVFTKTATGWHQTAELKGSDTSANDEFGYAVDVSSNTIVVGSTRYASGAGRAYVFEG